MINLAFVAYLIGLLLSGLAAAMLATALVEWWLDAAIWIGFFTAGVVTGFVALALVLATRRTTTTRLTLRSAFLFTVLSWTVVSLFAALPLELAVGTISFTDAVFEAVSGLTTTGSTVLIDLDRVPRGILFWRSMLHWLGGIGIIATAIVLLPMLRVGGMQLFRAESSERSDQLMGRPGEVGAAILAIYTLLTGLCALGYRWGGMNGFDAVNHAMSTLSTGGFSTYDASFAAFDDPFLELVAVAFMMAGALPFLAYVRTLWGRGHPLWRDSQVLAFVLTMVLASLVAWVLVLAALDEPAGRAFARAAFNVVSIATTTGFASGDFQTWGAFAPPFFLLLMLIGGCTGSTSGSVKIFRYQVVWREMMRQLERLVTPNLLRVATIDGRPVPGDVAPSVLVFLFLFFGAIMVGTLGLAATGLDLVTSLSGAATALANVGPGLGPVIGPAGTFAPLSDPAKWMLAAGMLLGRLEVFSVVVLLTPHFWRR